MHFVRLQSHENEIYSETMELYGDAFPIYEQRKPAMQKKIMACSDYYFNLIYDAEELVGIILCWENESFIYVEHFCIFPEKRNKRYGQKALELLGERGKMAILEIDPPITDVAISRKGFYERAGYMANEFAHVHPPYQDGREAHELVLMSAPRRITQEEYIEFDKYVRNVVMRE